MSKSTLTHLVSEKGEATLKQLPQTPGLGGATKNQFGGTSSTHKDSVEARDDSTSPLKNLWPVVEGAPGAGCLSPDNDRSGLYGGSGRVGRSAAWDGPIDEKALPVDGDVINIRRLWLVDLQTKGGGECSKGRQLRMVKINKSIPAKGNQKSTRLILL